MWRAESDEGDCALRATDAEQVDLTRLRGLHRLLQHIAAAGIEQSPAPLATDDAVTCVVQENRVWQLEPWRHGSADREGVPSGARLRSALRLLARWHVAARTFVPRPDEAPWFRSSPAGSSPGIGERLQRIAGFDEARCATISERLRRREWPEFDDCGLEIIQSYRRRAACIAAELETVRRLTVALQPCLRDVWREHLLFNGEEATGLIDAHACRSESVATDIARLLGSFVGDDRGGWEVGLAAYREVRPLSIDERGLVELFDRSSVLLSGLSWLEWRVLEGRRFDDPAAVVARLRRIAERLARLPVAFE